MSRVSQAAGAAGAAARHYGDADPRTIERRQSLAEAQIETAIERALASAPPLTDDQADRLAGLLRGAASTDGADE